MGNALSMRVANFKVGFEKSVDYGTTSDQNNKFFREESNRDSLHANHKSQVLAQKDRIMRNRVPHYELGRTPVDYVTSSKR